MKTGRQGHTRLVLGTVAAWGDGVTFAVSPAQLFILAQRVSACQAFALETLIRHL